MDKKREADYISRVEGVNKVRDYRIIHLHAMQPELTNQELVNVLELNLHQSRVSQILMDNSSLILQVFQTENPLATQEGRNVERAKHYNRKKHKSRKDAIDILDSMETRDVSIATATSITVVNYNEKKVQGKTEDRDTSSSSRVLFRNAPLAAGDTEGV